MATSCIYKTVTLQSGEKFVLPSGAELVSATNPSLITSDCVDINNLEALSCYGCEFNVTDSNPVGGGNTPQGFRKDIYGLKVKGVEYLFDTMIQIVENTSASAVQNALVSRINNLSISGLFTDVCAGVYYSFDDEGQGEWWRVVFKSLESVIGNDSYLMIISEGGPDNSGVDIKEFAPILPFSQLSLSVNSGTCACSNET